MIASSSKQLHVSVIVRSYNRVSEMIELVNRCLQQDYESFEIVIVEQSGAALENYAKEIAALEKDVRVHLHRYAPLGPTLARNEGLKKASGDILLFIDDDDLPVNNDWISSFVENFHDPDCIGVTGRMVFDVNEDPQDYDSRKSHRKCLRYSFFKVPSGRVQHSKHIKGTTILHGTNSAFRKEYVSRTGGWDPGYANHEENSMDFKLKRIMNRNQYFMYDPDPVVLRRLDITGGSDRRSYSARRTLREEWIYYGKMVRRYFPFRFYLFFPVYLFVTFRKAFDHYRVIDKDAGLFTFIRRMIFS